MKRIGLLVALCATSPAWASPPAEREAAADLVQSQLIRPLTAREARRSRFSRALPAPTARRVRILDEVPRKDDKGAAFVRFAIDQRGGLLLEADENGWQRDAEVGCVYLDRRQIFIRLADKLYPVDILFGKRADVAEPQVCQPKAEIAAATAR